MLMSYTVYVTYMLYCIYAHVHICMYIHMYNMYNIKLCMSMCIHDAVSTWRWLFLIIIVSQWLRRQMSTSAIEPLVLLVPM